MADNRTDVTIGDKASSVPYLRLTRRELRHAPGNDPNGERAASSGWH